MKTVPRFTGREDMLNFLRNIPPNANYDKLLHDDYGINVPKDAASFLKEYQWKYMVQGEYMGMTGTKLQEYAARKAVEFGAIFPWKKEPVAVAAPVAKPAKPAKAVKTVEGGRQRINSGKLADGTTLFLEHRQKWVGYWDGRIQCTKNSQEAVIEYLQRKFG